MIQSALIRSLSFDEFLNGFSVKLDLAIQWAKFLRNAIYEASHDLVTFASERTELLQGIKRQVQILLNLKSFLDACSVDGQLVSSEIETRIFRDICNAFSLYPQNTELLALLRFLFVSRSKSSFRKLRSALHGKLVCVHISCQNRLDRARKSVESFGQSPAHEAHLIVTGSELNCEPGFSFFYDSGILQLSVGDSYEFHYQKTLFTHALLSLLLDSDYVLKLDDDVSCRSRPQFDSFVSRVYAQQIDYAGTMASPSPRGVYKGWHIGKCLQKSFEQQGIAFLSSIGYAKGGYGYLLSRKSLSVICHYFFSTPLFYSDPVYPFLEDVIIGFLLHLDQIKRTHVSTMHMGLHEKNMLDVGSRQCLDNQLMADRLKSIVPYLKT